MSLEVAAIPLSNLDKHRRVNLPNRLTPELSVETGIDLGDGSLFHSPEISTRGSYYVYSISQRFPDEWFGVESLIKPLIEGLYNLRPHSKRSSLKRNGINVYTYSKALYFFKTRVLGLPSGSRSRKIILPVRLSFLFDQQASFWSGYQYADGSFYCTLMDKPVIKITTSSVRLFEALKGFASTLGVNCNFGTEHEHLGYSLRIFAERSLLKWIEHVPLLNPVHIARFLLWLSGSGYPPGLHMSQYMDLILGHKEVSQFSTRYERNLHDQNYLDETIQLVSLICLGTESVAFDIWRHMANLQDIEQARDVEQALTKIGLVTSTSQRGTSWLELTDHGLSKLEDFKTFWDKLVGVSQRLMRSASARGILKLRTSRWVGRC